MSIPRILSLHYSGQHRPGKAIWTNENLSDTLHVAMTLRSLTHLLVSQQVFDCKKCSLDAHFIRSLVIISAHQQSNQQQSSGSPRGNLQPLPELVQLAVLQGIGLFCRWHDLHCFSFSAMCSDGDSDDGISPKIGQSTTLIRSELRKLEYNNICSGILSSANSRSKGILGL